MKAWAGKSITGIAVAASKELPQLPGIPTMGKGNLMWKATRAFAEGR